MSNGIHIAGPVAFMSNSGAAVYFSKEAANAGSWPGRKGTSAEIRKQYSALEVAYWGEDNRFPQNISGQMAYCGIGKSALDWKARALYGGGIIPGKILDYQDDGKTEVFKPLTRAVGKKIYAFIENRSMFRFWLEYLQDWTWYANCFAEAIFSEDCSEITHFIHQESCDCRFKQTNDQGVIDTMYLSKMWGTTASQYAKFDPTKAVYGTIENPRFLTEIDNKFLKPLDCIDMYDPLNSALKIADKKKNEKGLKSAIFPTNYPSSNKTYYQVPYWDGARLGGWVEIACKIPAIIKMFLQKGQKVQFHIEVPETYFEKKYTKEKWKTLNDTEQLDAKRSLLKEMDDFLTNDKSNFSTMVSFFDVDAREHSEYGRMKITPIENKYNIDKDLITSSAAELQILAAMAVHPTLFGAGSIASGAQRTGGSDQREAYLIYNAMLKLEREVALEPLYLARDFNQWGDDIVFRIRDTQLTTLDQNSGTTKIVS